VMDGVDLCCRAGLERGAHNLLKAKIDLLWMKLDHPDVLRDWSTDGECTTNCVVVVDTHTWSTDGECTKRRVHSTVSRD